MRRVSYALHKLASRFIQQPQGVTALEVMEDFKKSSAFPNVIETIDGIHIKIKASSESAEGYIKK